MRKIKNFRPNFKNYGKINTIKREYLDKKQDFKIKILGATRSLLAVLTAVSILFGIYLVYVRYIVDESKTESDVFVPTLQEDESSDGLVEKEDEFIFIVNEDNPLLDDYQAELIEVHEILIDKKIETALNDMCIVAREDGLVLEFASGYVSAEEQKGLYEKKVDELIKSGHTSIMAKAKASFYSPKANESDTQTGLCVTLSGESKDFEKTNVYAWLIENAADYGFTFRYPLNKEKQTMQQTDLRVLRYVGEDDAVTMRRLGLCLEEYFTFKNAK